MHDRDRIKLLFGPYRAPHLTRGERANCLYRDTTVVITGLSDAPIPWPRCRALDSTGGGSGLLVDEELARAVRHESAAAVGYWWGVSNQTRYVAQCSGPARVPTVSVAALLPLACASG
jgi:hypothetical protein